MTDIDPSPKCKKRDRWVSHWAKNDGKSSGYAQRKNCGAKI